MKTMQRIGLMALVLAAGMLFMASPAIAGKKGDATSRIEFQLTPPATDAPEPDASGTCAVRQDSKSAILLDVSVKCAGLTAGATYDVTGASIGMLETHAVTADARGRINADFPFEGNIATFVGLRIVNDGGELVLEGYR